MKIKEVIVVEGKNDTKKLQTFFDVETIETNGTHLSNETLKMIEDINKIKGVIVFTDPDAPGDMIRNKINSHIKGLKNAFVFKENARTTKKVGIEHASKEILEEALSNLVTYTDQRESLSLSEFNDLGLNGQEDSAMKRLKIAKLHHLGKCNAKTMYKRLNMLNLTYDEIKKELE